MAKAKTSVKPETERILYELQESYLKDRNKSDYDKMFILMISYSKSLLLKLLKGKTFLPQDTVEDYAIEASLKMMSEYNKPNYKIDLSFAGLLRLKLLECLWAPKVQRTDKISSLNEHIENSKSSHFTEVGDLAESLGFKYLWRPESEENSDMFYSIVNRQEDAINSASSVVQDIYTSVNLHTFFKVSLGLLLFLEQKKTYQSYVDKFLSSTQKDVLDQTILEIYKRLRESS